MKQKHSHYRDCSADRGLSTLLLHSQTSRKIRLRTNFFSSLLVNPTGLETAKNFERARNIDRVLHE